MAKRIDSTNPSAAVRRSATALPEADASAAETVVLSAKPKPLVSDEAKETRMIALLGELRGIMGVCQIAKTEASKPDADSGDGFACVIDESSALTGRVWREMVSIQPTSLAGIAAFAEGLKIDACSHYWHEPKDDRDWDILLCSELIDLLIEFAPGRPLAE